METKEFKGTKGKWSINYWKQGDRGVIYMGEVNGIKHYTGDNVCKEIYSIVSDLHPNEHNVEHSFEGAHIAEISARNEESLANAQLIAAALELETRLQQSTDMLNALLVLFGDHMAVTTKFAVSQQIKENEKAIDKALGL